MRSWRTTGRAAPTRDSVLTVIVPPIFAQEPTNLTVNQGSTTNVAAGISSGSTTPLSYQWYFNGTNPIAPGNAIAWATNASMTLTNVQTSNAGGYSLLASNLAGTNLTITAWLSVVANGSTNYGWGSGGAPPSAPAITMLSPTNTASTNPAIYLYGPAISIRASATDNRSGYITNVTFYAGTTNRITSTLSNTVVGPDTMYALDWTNASPGSNVLEAVAWDNYGKSATSAVVYVIMDGAPTVSAGTNQTVVWAGGPTPTNLTLAGSVTDDGLPYGVTNLGWTVANGNANNVSFSNPTSAVTTATFNNVGIYTLRLSANDGFASNNATCTVTVELPPVVAMVGPTNNAVIQTSTNIGLYAAAYATNSWATVTNVSFYDYGTNSLGLAYYDGGDGFSLRWPYPANGTHSLTAVAIESSDGLMSTSAPVNVTIQANTIYLAVNAPASNQMFPESPTNVLFNVTARNVQGGMGTNVAFYNGSAYLGAGTASTNYTYQFLWQGVTNGTYTVTVQATNNFGNSAATNVQFTLNAVPTVSITSPTTGQQFTEVTNVTITASAASSDSTIASVQFLTYGSNGVTSIGSFSTNGASASNVVCSLTWSNLYASNYNVFALATDQRGGVGASPLTVFTVVATNPPPTVQVLYPTNNAVFNDGASISITATATNWPATVTNVEFFVNGLPVGNAPNAPYGVTICCWTTGTYTLVAAAADSYGAVGYSTNITITVASEPVGLGFWDPLFGPTNSVSGWPDSGNGGPGIPADECGNHENLVGCTSARLYGSSLYFSAVNFDWLSGLTDTAVYEWNGTNWSRWGTTITNDPPDGSGHAPPFVTINGVAADASGMYVNGLNRILTVTRSATGTAPTGPSWGRLFKPACSGRIRTTPDCSARGPTSRSSTGDLYLYGNVSNASVQAIGRWVPNSLQWEAMGGPLNGAVYAAASWNGNLYIGGSFTNVGPNSNVSYVAQLSGTTWTKLGAGVGGTNWNVVGYSQPVAYNSAVFSLAACGSNLFAGGDFTWAGNQTNANGIAVWNGSAWSTIGQGLLTRPVADELGDTNYPGLESTTNPLVYSISPHGTVIYIAGAFTDALNPDGSDVPVASVAKANWSDAAQQWSGRPWMLELYTTP